MNPQNKSHSMTTKELNQARTACDIIRRTPTVTGEDAAMVIDKAIAAILEEGERADRAESILHEISASLTNGPDIGPDLPNAVKDELAALNSQLEQVSTGRAISMTLQLKTRKVAHSISCLTVMLEQLPDEVKEGLSPEVAGVIQEWLADQLETVPTAGDSS